jgi:hypothetical protein
MRILTGLILGSTIAVATIWMSQTAATPVAIQHECSIWRC